MSRYSNRCGAVLGEGHRCQVPVVVRGERCRHHSKDAAGRAHNKAVRKARFLREAQEDEARGARSTFNSLAFDHGLTDPRVEAALTRWREAVARIGTDHVPEHVLPPKEADHG